MSGTSKLRWARYDGVDQPALHIPAEELADTEMLPGYSAVYLLGLDTTVMVPDTDLSPYNPLDTVKASHPAAALGVATARQILEGFDAAADDDAAVAADDSHEGRPPPRAAAAADDRDDDTAPAEERLAPHQQQHSSDDEDDVGDDDSAERRRRRREEKRKRKEEKKAAKEERRAAKAAVKREREEQLSAPTLRTRESEDGGDADAHGGRDHDDDDDELLAAMNIEARYKQPRGRDAAVTRDGDGDGDAARATARKARQDDGGWTALEAELLSEEEEDDDGGGGANNRASASGAQRRPQSGGRLGQALQALHSTRAAPAIAGLAMACPFAEPYLMEISYEYRQQAQEAMDSGFLLSRQEGEVVGEIDAELRRRAAERAYLLSVMQQRHDPLTRPVEGAADGAEAVAAAAEAEREKDALAEAVDRLAAPLNVAEAVRRLTHKQMASSTGAFDRAAAVRARRAVQRRTRTFHDASVVTLLEQLRAVDAAPREDGAEVMRRYVQQRRQHQDMKVSRRGLSKTGFYAVPKPLEKWRRGRDMMLLAHGGAEAQRVRPTSYISQTYSTMRQRMQAHAEKRFAPVTVVARDTASFLDPHSFTVAADAAAAAAAATPAGLSVWSPQQSRLAAANAVQRREAFFQFHELRCEPEAPVTLETVPLNAGFASGNTLASGMVDSVNVGGRAASLGHGEDDGVSLHTEDGVSLSYSVHSAAPSSYPYLFDNEPRTRRQRRRRGGSASARSSDADGLSTHTSRAASVASAHSAKGDKDGDDATANEHRRRATTTTTNATLTGADDWRSHAKRSIMEQLTLYRRGRHGKPALLTDDQCRDMGRLLLERAMRAEAERQGLSLAVQCTNVAAPFTKVTEQRLKKSVDHYLERRMQQGTLALPTVGQRGGGAGVLGDAVPPAPLTGHSRHGVLPYDAAAEARQRAVADTPIFED